MSLKPVLEQVPSACRQRCQCRGVGQEGALLYVPGAIYVIYVAWENGRNNLILLNLSSATRIHLIVCFDV